MTIPVCEFGKIHFNFKFHELSTVDGFLTDYVTIYTNIDDRNVVWDLCAKYNSIFSISDKCYINKKLTTEVKTKVYPLSRTI